MTAPAPLAVVHVEDDDVIREVTALGLSRLGYSVHSEADGLEGLEYLRMHPADVVLLDVMLPSLSGASICRRLREFSEVPIIMLSARDDSVDVVAGLEAGADDYVTKPVDLDVLDARIRAVLRRTTTGAANGAPSPVEVDVATEHSGVERSAGLGAALPAEPAHPTPDAAAPADTPSPGTTGLRIDHHRMEVTLDGRNVHLTPTEWRILVLLLDAAGGLVSRQKLLDGAWEDAWAGDGRLVDVHVQRLRRKVGSQRIETVRGFGYRWHE